MKEIFTAFMDFCSLMLKKNVSARPKALHAIGPFGEKFTIKMVKFFPPDLPQVFLGKFSKNILPALKFLVSFGFQSFSGKS